MRWLRDEYMTGAASPGDRVLSAVSLALFADSGWYADADRQMSACGTNLPDGVHTWTRGGESG